VGDWIRHVATSVLNAFDRVTPMRVILAAFVCALIIVHGLAPAFTIDGVTIGLLAFLLVTILTPLLRSASFPGGSVEFREVGRLAETARALRDDALQLPGMTVTKLPPGSAPSFATSPPPEPVLKGRQAPVGAEGSVKPEATRSGTPEGGLHVGRTTYDDILVQAHESPKLALLLLTGELEDALSRLAARSGHHLQRQRASLLANTRELGRAGILPPSAEGAMRQFTEVRNRIAHGDFSAGDELALATVDIGVSILNTIELIESSRASDTVQKIEESEPTNGEQHSPAASIRSRSQKRTRREP